MMILTRSQRLALYKVFRRPTDAPQPVSYLTFRRTVQPGSDCIMVPWCGMWLGIESDGYTHS